MRNLSLILLVALAFGCGDSDITDDPQIDLDAISNIDAPPGLPDADVNPPDADMTQPDADTTQPDADVTTPDADVTTPDADTTQPDASSDPGQIFCDRYDTLCTYNPADNNRFDDEAACLAAYDGFTTPQQTCVENQLDQLEIDSNLNHCRSAMGKPPCN